MSFSQFSKLIQALMFAALMVRKNCSMKQTVRANPFTLGKLCESPSLLTHLCNEKIKNKKTK